KIETDNKVCAFGPWCKNKNEVKNDKKKETRTDNNKHNSDQKDERKSKSIPPKLEGIVNNEDLNENDLETLVESKEEKSEALEWNQNLAKGLEKAYLTILRRKATYSQFRKTPNTTSWVVSILMNPSRKQKLEKEIRRVKRSETKTTTEK
ncbi:23178_t:CDS:2, partial [Gigaspora rosea]